MRECSSPVFVFQLNETLVDPVLGSAEKSGYQFTGGRTLSTPIAPPTFFYSARPVVVSGTSMTGGKRFGVTTDGTIHADFLTASHFSNTLDVLVSPPIQ